MISTEIHIPLLIFLFAIFWLLSILGTVYYFHRLLRRERKLKDGMDQLLTFTDLCTFVFDMRKDTMRLSTACANLLGLPEEVDNFTEKCQEDSDQHKSCQSLLQAMTPEADQQRMQLTRANGSYGTYRVTNRIYYTKNEEIDYIIGILTDITQEVHREEHLALHAQIDGLTHVYNSGTVRRLLSDTMTDFDENDLGAFLILDIDNFKKFNDLYGHQTGDQVLRIVARVLKEQLRVNDVIGRLGGDEFCAYLPGLSSIGFLSSLCERLNQSVTETAAAEGIKVPVTISIGATMLHTFDDFLTAYDRADQALYAAKEKGRNGYVAREGRAETETAEATPQNQ
jgi:diguanylate cyclase (GGDEF)-like protein